MEILLTNDDGWGAKGLLTLLRVAERLGHVTVVAPDGARSGMSNAISVEKAMTLSLIEKTEAHDVYITNGTPSDCIKLAVNVIYTEKMPDLVISGINHGSNASVNVIYSGTMGACFVAAEQSIPAIGLSLCDHDLDADFSYLEPFIVPLVKQLLERGFPDGVCYNVNAPVGKIEGISFTRQSRAHWANEIAVRYNAEGTPYYWLQGEFVNHEPESHDTDEWAMAHGRISVCPCSIDMSFNARNIR